MNKGQKLEVEQIILKFKLELLKKYPFYGDFLIKIPIIEDANIATAATNGKEIRYNRKFLGGKQEREIAFIIMHEVLHIMLLHWKRCEGRDSDVWNIACDMTVNEMLQGLIGTFGDNKVFMEVPKDAVFSKYYLRTTETRYNELMKSKKEIGNTLFLKVNNDNRRDRLIKVKRKSGDLIRAEGKEEELLIEAAVKDFVREAVKKSRSEGMSYYIPEIFLTYFEKRKVKWNEILKDFMEDNISEEYSYYTPERKYLYMDLILPGRGQTKSKIREIWAFVDDSGSVCGSELNAFATQLHIIAKTFGSTINLVYWNTSIDAVYKRVTDPKKIFECLPKGSGGTDINCVYEYIEAEGIKPEVMIILTDGYFGTLETKFQSRSLFKKTIVALSEEIKSKPVMEWVKSVGKIAYL